MQLLRSVLVWRPFLLSIALSMPSQAYQSFGHMTDLGLTFVPANPIEYLAGIANTNSIERCFAHCNLNFLCRTLVYDSAEMVCTLYEGLMETGLVVPSPSTATITGGLMYIENLFMHYGDTCDNCFSDRYLQCSNASLCDCPTHSFFNGAICQNQFYHAHICSTANACREDLGLQCVIGICQCNFGTAWNETECITMPSIITVAGTGTGGTSLAGPVDLAVTSNGTLYEAEWGGNRVRAFAPNNTHAILSQLGMGSLRGICVDNGSSNYYVTGDGNVTMWPSNTTIITFSGAFGIATDSDANLYVSNEFVGTVIFWNATSNTLRTVVSGLNSPRHLYLDEENQLIYVADRTNHRIVKTQTNGGGNLTVVAGGNGIGHGFDQLSNPNGVCVSQKTGAVYVADTGNHRIQRWAKNARFGITLAGYPNGTPSNTMYGLNGPYAVAMDTSEAFLYVTDFNNNRVQRIPLI